jgi:short-subunit dehydrogenase
MATQLKPLSEQVIVITGASSGIGLATAEDAARQGARLVIAARSGTTLKEIAGRLSQSPGQVIAMECDVSEKSEVEKLAAAAIEHFGHIDTWINNAGQGLYGRVDQVTEADARRLFDINFWGVVNGSLAALPHLKKNGGALINVGSEVSEAYVPLLGIYTATKHAVKGFTDTLRVEIEEVDNAPVSVTLIQPTAVDTPFPQHARNYQDQEAKLPSPQIEAAQVADAILKAAVRPVREVKVGFRAAINTFMSHMLPGMTDRIVAGHVDRQHYNEAPRNPSGTLYEPGELTGTAGQIKGSGGQESE